jgi:hypothetical protein
MYGKELLLELQRRGCPTLFHACTLGTLQSYSKLGAYRSRSAVEAAGLPLTPQVSDDADRRLGIWNHLFLNIFDQHADVHNGRSVTGLNKYGPITMVFNAGVLDGVEGEIVGYRREITRGDYDPAVHEVRRLDEFRAETFRDASAPSSSCLPSRRPGTPGPNMCVHYDDSGAGVPFAGYLKKVIVDQLPAIHKSLQQEMTGATTNAICDRFPETPIEIRECIVACGCRDAYARMTTHQVRAFFVESNMEVYSMRLPRQSRR